MSEAVDRNYNNFKNKIVQLYWNKWEVFTLIYIFIIAIVDYRIHIAIIGGFPFMEVLFKHCIMQPKLVIFGCPAVSSLAKFRINSNLLHPRV